jgi:isopenicillin N synthase-like dioxygenase
LCGTGIRFIIIDGEYYDTPQFVLSALRVTDSRTASMFKMTARNKGGWPMDAYKIETGNGEIYANKSIEAEIISDEEIPVLDAEKLSQFLSCGDTGHDAELELYKIINYCTTIGFFYVKNHGISRENRNRIFASAKTFFDLSMQEKMSYYNNDKTHIRGYNPANKNTNKNGIMEFLESFYMGSEPIKGKTNHEEYAENIWPERPDDFYLNVSSYYNSMTQIGNMLFAAFCKVLSVDEKIARSMITYPGCKMRLIHYPNQSGVDEGMMHLGARAHTDHEWFTILTQDNITALQILNRKNKWIWAKPKDDYLLINIGDQLSRFTNGYLRSTVHRVLNMSGLDRYSVAFFYNINYDTVVTPLEIDGAPKSFEPFHSGDFIIRRRAATYA